MRQVIQIEQLGNIRVREDGKLHMYFLSKGADDITHEIVLSEEATRQFKTQVELSTRTAGEAFGFRNME